jgi:RNA-directed DNA polymerase
MAECRFKKADKVHLVRYADDEIVTGRSKELLEDRVKPLLMNFLQERGLEFSEEKTRITHIDDGFDFLGFNIRKYHGKLLIKPSKSAVKAVKEKIRGLIMSHKTVKTDTLIGMLNPIIRGWGNNYRHVVSKKVFVQIDHAIWQATWKWARRRHPNKSPRWIKSKYYQRMGQRGWVFKERNGTKELVQMADIPIRRHIQIKAEANPYDPAWKDYLKERDGKQRKIKPCTREDRLWLEQEGKCVMCQTPLEEDEPWDAHHLVPKEAGGTDTRGNLVLLHAVCHRQVHSQYSMRDRLPGASRRLIRA